MLLGFSGVGLSRSNPRWRPSGHTRLYGSGCRRARHARRRWHSARAVEPAPRSGCGRAETDAGGRRPPENGTNRAPDNAPRLRRTHVWDGRLRRGSAASGNSGPVPRLLRLWGGLTQPVTSIASNKTKYRYPACAWLAPQRETWLRANRRCNPHGQASITYAKCCVTRSNRLYGTEVTTRPIPH